MAEPPSLSFYRRDQGATNAASAVLRRNQERSQPGRQVAVRDNRLHPKRDSPGHGT